MHACLDVFEQFTEWQMAGLTPNNDPSGTTNGRSPPKEMGEGPR